MNVSILSVRVCFDVFVLISIFMNYSITSHWKFIDSNDLQKANSTQTCHQQHKQKKNKKLASDEHKMKKKRLKASMTPDLATLI